MAMADKGILMSCILTGVVSGMTLMGLTIPKAASAAEAALPLEDVANDVLGRDAEYFPAAFASEGEWKYKIRARTMGNTFEGIKVIRIDGKEKKEDFKYTRQKSVSVASDGVTEVIYEYIRVGELGLYVIYAGPTLETSAEEVLLIPFGLEHLSEWSVFGDSLTIERDVTIEIEGTTYTDCIRVNMQLTRVDFESVYARDVGLVYSRRRVESRDSDRIDTLYRYSFKE